MRIYFLGLLVLLFFSCKKKGTIPNDILEKQRMQELIWDLARADAFLTNFAGRNDSVFNRIKESATIYYQVFKIHKTTREEFSKSFEWYQQHPALMKTILDSLKVRQNKIMQDRSKPSVTTPIIDSLTK